MPCSARAAFTALTVVRTGFFWVGLRFVVFRNRYASRAPAFLIVSNVTRYCRGREKANEPSESVPAPSPGIWKRFPVRNMFPGNYDCVAFRKGKPSANANTCSSPSQTSLGSTFTPADFSGTKSPRTPYLGSWAGVHFNGLPTIRSGGSLPSVARRRACEAGSTYNRGR
jgi:hypothetical protein